MNEEITYNDVALMVEALRGEARRLLARSKRRDSVGPATRRIGPRFALAREGLRSWR